MSTKEVKDTGLTFMEEFELLNQEMTPVSRKKKGSRDLPESGSAPKRSRKRGTRKATAGREKTGGVKLSGTEKALITAGCTIAVLAVALSGIIVEARQVGNAIRSFREVGTGMEGIAMIGEEGVVAVGQARYDAQLKAEREKAKKEAEKIDEKDIIKVDMTAQTIKGDLKIKFIEQETGRLVEGVPFAAKVTDPGGQTERYIDDDKNGIIYLEEIKPGDYIVEEDEITGKKYAKYRVSAAKHTVAVSNVLAYQAIDVSDEVKDQSEVNTAAEDNMDQNDTPDEGHLTDTVEFVESTKTLISGGDSFAPLDRNEITDPYKTASVKRGGNGRGLAALSNENEEEYPYYVEVTAEKIKIRVNESVKLRVVVRGAGDDVTITGTTFSSDSTYAAVQLDGTVTGSVGGGTSSITATVTMTGEAWEGEKFFSGSISITVEEETDTGAGGNTENDSISFPDGNLKVTEGNTGRLNINWTKGLGGVNLRSSDEGVVKVAMDGSYTAVKAGEATITASGVNNASVNAVCKITVSAPSQNVNDNAELKDNKGRQVYVKDGSGYRRAVNSDYRSAGEFFVMTSSTEVYRYTGFQTLNGRTYYFDRSGNKITGDHVIGGVQYKFDAEGALVQGNGARGIDVSQYNGAIDWAQVKASGVDFAIIRLGYRGWGTGVLVEDSRFRQNVNGALATASAWASTL